MHWIWKSILVFLGVFISFKKNDYSIESQRLHNQIILRVQNELIAQNQINLDIMKRERNVILKQLDNEIGLHVHNTIIDQNQRNLDKMKRDRDAILQCLTQL